MKIAPFIVLVLYILCSGCKKEETSDIIIHNSWKNIKISGKISNWTKMYQDKYDIYETGINGDNFKDSGKVTVSPDGSFTFEFPENRSLKNWKSKSVLGNLDNKNAKENSVTSSSGEFYFSEISFTLFKKGDNTFKPAGELCKRSHYKSQDYSAKYSPITEMNYVYFESTETIHGMLKEQLTYLPRNADISTNFYDLSFKRGWNKLVTHVEYSQYKYKSEYDYFLSEIRSVISNMEPMNMKWYVQIYNPLYIGGI